MDPSDIHILRSALRNNERKGITGLLWRTGGQFFQALHGPADQIDDLLVALRADPRHADMEILLRGPGPLRTPFPDWAMGFDYVTLELMDLALGEDDDRPPVDEETAERIYDEMVRQAIEQESYGSAFPYARKPGESNTAYLERLNLAG